MYNEQQHIVVVFKDYLIFDDFSEYLKRFYARNESIERLPRVFDFYAQTIKLTPSFFGVSESVIKLMIKNSDRKNKK